MYGTHPCGGGHQPDVDIPVRPSKYARTPHSNTTCIAGFDSRIDFWSISQVVKAFLSRRNKHPKVPDLFVVHSSIGHYKGLRVVKEDATASTPLSFWI